LPRTSRYTLVLAGGAEGVCAFVIGTHESSSDRIMAARIGVTSKWRKTIFWKDA
jgi:hypothetical protein